MVASTVIMSWLIHRGDKAAVKVADHPWLMPIWSKIGGQSMDFFGFRRDTKTNDSKLKKICDISVQSLSNFYTRKHSKTCDQNVA